MRQLWKPLPYSRLRECDFLNKVDVDAPSNWIAAIKIYLAIVMKSDIDIDGNYCATLTYPEFQKITGMSRQLICNGLSKLNAFKIIKTDGLKKKKYSILVCKKGSTIQNPELKNFSGLSDGAWCKLPINGLVGNDGSVPSFLAMTNRNVNELHALRLFVYLLSIRRKGDVFIVVSESTLIKKLGIKDSQLYMALSHMSSIGFIVKSRYRNGDSLSFRKNSAYAFLLCGWDVFEWYHNNTKELDWKESYMSDFDNWV